MEQSLSYFLRESGFSEEDHLKAIDLAFTIYSQFLNKWNQAINLISRAGPSLDHHLFDSLQYMKVVPREGRFLDIGSGAGFPGVPIKIVLPNVQMVLLESQRKRANFLKSLIRALNLEDIRVIHNRAENLHQELRSIKCFDVVLFRGVGEPEICLSLGEPFLKTGGFLILKQAIDFVCTRESKKMEMEREIQVEGLKGEPSKLMVFRKSST